MVLSMRLTTFFLRFLSMAGCRLFSAQHREIYECVLLFHSNVRSLSQISHERSVFVHPQTFLSTSEEYSSVFCPLHGGHS